MWVYVLLGVYVLICVVLITAVLLQPGKADAAALFGGGASQTAFGPRGAQNVLGWTTWITAAIMVLLALVFSLPRVFGPKSVIQGGEAPVPVQQSAPPSQPPAPGSKPPAASQTPPIQESKQPAATKPETKSESKPPASSSQSAPPASKPKEPNRD
ncbi:MAG: preprotein translocase subunit SecG [Acidobacteria bacterium]|nr:preprotein translocase subunit SecG [Acidobacteriota bacterium]